MRYLPANSRRRCPPIPPPAPVINIVFTSPHIQQSSVGRDRRVSHGGGNACPFVLQPRIQLQGRFAVMLRRSSDIPPSSALRQMGPTPRAGRDPYFGPLPHPSEPSIPSTGPRALRSRPAAPRELRGRSAVGVAPLVVTA